MKALPMAEVARAVVKGEARVVVVKAVAVAAAGHWVVVEVGR